MDWSQACCSTVNSQMIKQSVRSTPARRLLQFVQMSCFLALIYAFQRFHLSVLMSVSCPFARLRGASPVDGHEKLKQSSFANFSICIIYKALS